MHRHSLRFTIGILAFLSGIVAVTIFDAKVDKRAATVETLVSDAYPIPPIEKTADVDETFVDEDSMSVAALKPVIKKWLRGGRIESEFTDISPASIKEIIGRDGEVNDSDSWIFMSFRYEPTLLDVDGDGQSELAIRNQCAPAVGNCRFHIFNKTRNRYKTILRTYGGEVQRFKLLKSRTNGYFDLETRSHGSASSGGISVYKFDGKKYRIRDCSSYDYTYLENGNVKRLKYPIIEAAEFYEE